MDEILSRRIFKRAPTKIKVRFQSGNTEYSGTATNLSKNGMLIKIKEMSFPFDSELEIFLLFKKEAFRVPARVSRVIKSARLYNGIGIELINPPRKYLDFVENLVSVSLRP